MKQGYQLHPFALMAAGAALIAGGVLIGANLKKHDSVSAASPNFVTQADSTSTKSYHESGIVSSLEAASGSPVIQQTALIPSTPS